MQHDMVSVELRWEVDDADEIQVNGDYIDITLPDGLTFPETQGTYTTSQQVTLPDGRVIAPGAVVATYEIKGNNLHIVHTQTAVDLSQSGRLMPGVQMGSMEWMRMTIEGVEASGLGTYEPCAITINGRTAKNPSPLIIRDRAPREITDVTLTQMLANDAASTTVNYNESVALSINWSWTGRMRFITSGDYFEVELPEQLAYMGHSRTITDSYGNEMKSECYIRESDGRWVLRVTYQNVHGAYNYTAGTERVMAYPKTTLSTGRHTLTAQVASGTSRASAVMNLTDNNVDLGGNEWVIRTKEWPNDSQVQNTDYQTNSSDYAIGNGGNAAKLYVIANHEGALIEDPFRDRNTIVSGNRRYYYQNVVDFESGVSNYLDAFCADQSNTSNPSGYYRRHLLTPNQWFRTANLSAVQVNRLINILSVAYPYNTLAEMSTALDYHLRRNNIYLAPGETIREGAAVSAVQQCIWNTIHGYGNDRVSVISGADSSYANRVLNALDDYARSADASANVGGGYNNVQYSFAQNPTITFNGNTATVSGTITPSPLPSAFTGTFTNGTQSVQFTVDEQTGRFSATLTGVSKRDTFNLEIDGVVPGETSVYYFESISSNHNIGHNQNVISCVKKNRKVNLDWQFNGIFARKVKVVKQWVDKNGNTITQIPDAEVQVTLYRRDKNGAVTTIGTVTLNKANGYTYLWDDLDLTDEDGDLYQYYVVETSVPAGYDYVGITPGAEDGGNTLVFTCKNTPEDTKVKVIKKWEGVSDEELETLQARVELHRKNADGSSSIMRISNAVRTETTSGIILRGDYSTTVGSEVRETLTKQNNFTVTFEGLPKFEADGRTRIEYFIKEVDLSGDFTVEITQPDMTLLVPTATVKNTREGSLTVVKKWLNADGTEEWSETLPGGILVQLTAKRNGVDISDNLLQQIVGGKTLVELNASNGWSYSWNSVHVKGMEYFISEVSFVRGNQDNYERVDENGDVIDWNTPVEAVWNEEKKAFEVAVFNKRRPVEVVLIKEDAFSGRKLEGAAFRLFDETGREVKNPNDREGLYRSDADGKVVFGSPEGRHLMISQVKSGIIHRYMLIEVEAPKGYINKQAMTSVTFYVQMNDGSPQVVIEKGQPWENPDGGVMVSPERTNWMIIRLKNEPVGFTLPETGGIGTTGYKTVGFMLICMAALFYIVTNQHFTKQFHTNSFVRKNVRKEE